MLERIVNPGENLNASLTQPTLSNVAPIAAIGAAIQNNAGITNLSGGVVFNVYTIPTSLTWSVSSNNATGSGTVTVYGFNNNVLNSAVVNNGAGADSIANTYGDGFSGKVYENYFRSANAGQGMRILGMTIEATNYTSGSQVSSVFSTMSLNIIAANGQGSTIPLPVNLQEAVRNTQYQSGILTIKKDFYLNSLTQLSLSLPKDTKLVFTLFTDASGFNG